MANERIVSIEIDRRDGYSPEELQVLNRYAEILPDLTKLSMTMNRPLELAMAQDEHVKIVRQAIDLGLLPEICLIRDQFRKELVMAGNL